VQGSVLWAREATKQITLTSPKERALPPMTDIQEGKEKVGAKLASISPDNQQQREHCCLSHVARQIPVAICLGLA
jgi:ribonuclease PH